MIVTTTEAIAGYRVTESLGQVFGVVVRSRGLGGNIVAGLRSIIGGEIKEYTALVEDTRRHAIDRLSINARLMGADAVVMMRFDSGSIGQTMNEVVAYGTAVKISPLGAAG
ncbi:MAG: heavy metal-binding domain-containing protein [Novosphingobium sp.]|nr:heavy metal-binding domain-containing protein [Novosphingobium sp.]